MGKPQIVHCPSGLAGEVRAFKAKEANLLADPRQARNVVSFDKVLRACWETTIDPGPYDMGEGGPDWSRALVADRFAALIGVRVATYGPDYEFQVNCANEACPGKRFMWGLNLETDLERKALPEESITVWLNDNRFPAKAGGKNLWFKLLTGADEARNTVRFRQSRDALITAALASRIVEIEGVHSNDKMHWLENLDMGEAMSLLDQFDSVDGGVETEIEVQCEHCLTVQDIELPFARDFFLPRQKKRPTPT